LDLDTIWKALIVVMTFAQPFFVLMAKYYLGKISATTMQIHVAVNSERTRMMAEVEALKDQISKLNIAAVREEGRETLKLNI